MKSDEIVFFWLENYRNIKNQGINFGSKYIYSFSFENKKIVVTRELNSKHIDGFFQNEENNNISNITAIVGENGSGKSNFLDALKSALTGDRDWFEYLIIMIIRVCT